MFTYSFKEAFFTDAIEAPLSVNENIPKDLDDRFYVYPNMKKLSETELEELKSLNWKEYPKILKIFYSFFVS